MSFVLLGILNSQAAGAGEIPASLNPDLWLDASDASTITESGGSVSQWDNKGSLENFTQATSASQPTTGVNTLNGLNVIDFASDFLTGSTKSQWKFLHNGTDYFFCMVAKVTGSSNKEGFFGSALGSGDIGLEVFYDGANPDAFRADVGRGVPGDFVLSVRNDNFISTGTFQVLSGFLDPDNATVADRVDLYTDETQATDVNTSTGSVSTSDPTDNLAVGAFSGSGTFPLTGSIAEMIIVSGANATEENRQGIVNYLNAKWSVF